MLKKYNLASDHEHRMLMAGARNWVLSNSSFEGLSCEFIIVRALAERDANAIGLTLQKEKLIE